MLDKARDHIEMVMAEGVKGPNKECKYYPCHHFEGQECTWCFCPFYPCLDPSTGGKWKVSERTGKDVWSCIDCRWVHSGTIPEKVLEGLRKLEDPQRLRRRLLEAGHG